MPPANEDPEATPAADPEATATAGEDAEEGGEGEEVSCYGPLISSAG